MVMKVKIHRENYPGFGAISDTRTTLLTTQDFKTLIQFISLLDNTCVNCQSISTFDALAFGATFPTLQTDMQTSIQNMICSIKKCNCNIISETI
jgi:hypothetical protein